MKTTGGGPGLEPPPIWFVAVACKPNSVPFDKLSQREATISLGPTIARPASSDLPAGLSVPGRGSSAYLVLLPVGFAMPPMSPPTRCALTAPFHPYPSTRCRSLRAGTVTARATASPRAVSFCCTFRRIAPPSLVIKHRALCSSDFPRRSIAQTARSPLPPRLSESYANFRRLVRILL